MDHRFPKQVIGVPLKSTRGLLLSEPYNQPHCTSTSSKITNHGSLGPKIIEIMKHKLSHGAKIIKYGGQGLLFVSTERVAFCSDRSIKTYSMTGEQLKFQYKVSIPLEKIKGVLESKNMKRPSSNYVELVTVDDFSFWFTGFISIKKTLRYLHQAAGMDYLST
ncbi:GEM-like protein 7 [Tanacetum coccineum]